MVQAISKTITFDEFIADYPEKPGCHYELHGGVIVEMPKPTGKHSEIAGFLMTKLSVILRNLQLPYFIPKECVIKVEDDTGYEPDIIILDREAVNNEQRWEKESVITLGSLVRLVVEVVSTNWHDDYMKKAADYEKIGILEYWIVDYLGLGGRRFIGNPKQPTISVHQLVDGEYQVKQFQGNSCIESLLFPDLNLSVEQIFQAA